MRPILPERLWKEFVATGDVDFAYEIAGVARFRVNVFRQQRGSGAVFRVIPTKIMTLEQLGLPEQVRRLAAMRERPGAGHRVPPARASRRRSPRSST